MIFKLHHPPESVIRVMMVYPIFTFYGEDVLSQVVGKLQRLFTDDLPPEWGGYLIFDGETDAYGSRGHLTFVLNHLGPNTTSSYKYLQELLDFLPTKRFFNYTEYKTFFDYEIEITERYPYFLVFVFNSLIPSSNIDSEFTEFVRESVLSKPTVTSAVTYTATLIGG